MENVVVRGTAKQTPKRRKQKAHIPKPDTDDSSDLTSLEYTSDSEPGKNATAQRSTSKAKRGVVSQDRPLPQMSQETPSASASRHNNRVMSKRNAARKSAIAVRSHYFEHNGTEIEDDIDDESSDEEPISRSKKRVTTSTGRISKAQGKVS